MVLLAISVGTLFYVWILFPLLLLGIALLVQSKFNGNTPSNDNPRVSVVIAVHNEERNIVSRVSNIYECDYPPYLVEVVVASDGSTDATKDVCAKLTTTYPDVRLVDIQPQQGRANAHNSAVLECAGDILIFTDADTSFEPATISGMVASFGDSTVGFVSGNLRYGNAGATDITESAGLYWKFERMLRALESHVGLFVFGTGACCAVRKSLFRPIPATGDVDFTTPLDVVLQGYSCVHEADVIAWDTMPETPEREFRARVRMTAKNLHGTITRWGVRGVIRHPLYTWVLLSHKIGRWLTPFGMLGVLLSTFLLLPDVWAALFLVMQATFYALAFAGSRGIRLPLAGAVYSFCLANLGFLVGVMKAATGNVPRAYKPINHQ